MRTDRSTTKSVSRYDVGKVICHCGGRAWRSERNEARLSKCLTHEGISNGTEMRLVESVVSETLTDEEVMFFICLRQVSNEQ